MENLSGSAAGAAPSGQNHPNAQLWRDTGSGISYDSVHFKNTVVFFLFIFLSQHLNMAKKGYSLFLIFSVTWIACVKHSFPN